MTELADIERRLRALERMVDRLTLDTRGRYYPVTPTNLIDSAATTWSAATPAAGTYTFRPEDNGMLWPSGAQAVVLLVLGSWASASSGSNLVARRTSAGTNEGYFAALVASIQTSAIFTVRLEELTGNFYFVVSGNMNLATARILGYIA